MDVYSKSWLLLAVFGNLTQERDELQIVLDSLQAKCKTIENSQIQRPLRVEQAAAFHSKW